MSAPTPTSESPRQRTASMQPARRETARAALDWRNLPRDVWGAIARAALRLEGDDVRAWARLSLVNRAWRAGIQGVLSQHAHIQPRTSGIRCDFCCNIRHRVAEQNCVPWLSGRRRYYPAYKPQCQCETDVTTTVQVYHSS